MNQTNIYVCYTVMHLYITLLKVDNCKKINTNNILIVTDHIHDYKIFSRKFNELKIFNEVIIIEDIKLNNKFKKSKTNLLFYKRNLITFFNSETNLKNLISKYYAKEVQINLFLDNTRTSHYFMFMYMNINLIEDGLSLYTEKKINFRELYKRFIAKAPKSFGFDDSIKTIEATNPEQLPRGIKKKAKLLDMNLLKNNLSNDKKASIINFFLEDKVNFNRKKKVLILTGPYSEEKIISEEYKVDLYRKILEPYKKDYIIYIKPHPRETTDYLNIVDDNSIILNKNFPIELLDLMLYEPFDKCITIDSSALKNLNCVREKIFLGIDFDYQLCTEYYKKCNVKRK